MNEPMSKWGFRFNTFVHSFRLYCDCRWCDAPPKQMYVYILLWLLYFGSALCTLCASACVWFRLEEADKIILLYNSPVGMLAGGCVCGWGEEGRHPVGGWGAFDGGDGIVYARATCTRDALHGRWVKTLTKQANHRKGEKDKQKKKRKQAHS